MRVVRLLLIVAFAAASGCAAFTQSARTPAVRPGQPAPLSAPDPNGATRPLPILPDPAAFAWPRVQLGQSVPTPPESVIARMPATPPATTIAVGATSNPLWSSGYESSQRRPIQTAIVGSGAEHVLITGSLSGNDPASVLALDALLDRLHGQPAGLDGRQALLVRNPHPDGLAEHIAVNARGVDLNRNFPSPRFTASPTRETGPHPASEAETRVMLRLLGETTPSRVIHVRTGFGERTLITGNAACLELLDQLRSEFDVDVATFDGEFKAGSLEEFAATRLKAQVMVIELPATLAGQPATADLLASAALAGRKATYKDHPAGEDLPVASQPATSPAALTGAVEPSEPDGEKGYVELLPAPPEFATDGVSATESRFYELSPPAEFTSP
ncbi:MAG: hypothetical protein JNG89_05880 [Planctomycetaceae bacterium]|nr:hypothetical protein [Planctomycetaceae bacterium]